jgi:hypothetical protein
VDEPGNNSAWLDRFGDTWVRSDEAALRRTESYGGLPEFHWWSLCEGPGWGDEMRGRVGTASPWASVEMHGPLEPGDGGKVQQVIDALEQELS